MVKRVGNCLIWNGAWIRNFLFLKSHDSYNTGKLANTFISTRSKNNVFEFSWFSFSPEIFHCSLAGVSYKWKKVMQFTPVSLFSLHLPPLFSLQVSSFFSRFSRQLISFFSVSLALSFSFYLYFFYSFLSRTHDNFPLPHVPRDVKTQRCRGNHRVATFGRIITESPSLLLSIPCAQ